jgi:hypothetical protein
MSGDLVNSGRDLEKKVENLSRSFFASGVTSRPSTQNQMTKPKNTKTKQADIAVLLREASLALAKSRKLLRQKARNGKKSSIRGK